MKLEQQLGIKGYRPHVTLMELPVDTTSPTRLATAICYDATDLDLVADLRDSSDMFLIAALNQDVQTFENMVRASVYKTWTNDQAASPNTARSNT